MAASPSTDHLSALPVELMHMVLINLPVRDLCRSRKLCKQINNIIDGNLKSFLQPAIAFHRNRLTSYCSDVLDTTNEEFIPALSRFIDNYGEIIKDRVAGADVLKNFCHLYSRQNHPALTNLERPFLDYLLFRVARLCVQGIATLRMQGDDKGPRGEQYREELCNGLSEFAAKLGDDKISRLIYVWDTVNISARPSSKVGDFVPEKFVAFRLSSDRDRKCYLGPFDDIPSFFGVPKLPCGSIFGYCINSHSLWRRLQHKKYTSNRPPPLFVKAAVLEELFIW